MFSWSSQTLVGRQRVFGVWSSRKCQLLAGQLHQSEANNYFRPITVPSPHCRTDHTLLGSTSPTLFEQCCGFFYNPMELIRRLMEHFALWVTSLVSNVLSLAWEWVSNLLREQKTLMPHISPPPPKMAPRTGKRDCEQSKGDKTNSLMSLPMQWHDHLRWVKVTDHSLRHFTSFLKNHSW